jgi:SAM-dependent methyltransferase
MDFANSSADKFDVIFNLGVSIIGLYPSESENEKAMEVFSSLLKKDGIFIFQYLNKISAQEKSETNYYRNPPICR